MPALLCRCQEALFEVQCIMAWCQHLLCVCHFVLFGCQFVLSGLAYNVWLSVFSIQILWTEFQDITQSWIYVSYMSYWSYNLNMVVFVRYHHIQYYVISYILVSTSVYFSISVQSVVCVHCLGCVLGMRMLFGCSVWYECIVWVQCVLFV